MDDLITVPRATLNVLRGYLVTTLPSDLGPRVFPALQRDILGGLRDGGLRHLVLDCSGLAVIDGEDFEGLRRIVAMAAVMGVGSVLVGLRPGVVSALVDLDVDVRDIRAALTLDDALNLLEDETEPGSGDRSEGLSGAGAGDDSSSLGVRRGLPHE